MKNTLKGLIVIVVLLSITAPSVLASNPNRNENRNSITIEENLKEVRKEASPTALGEGDVREINNGLLEKVKNFVKKNLKFEARVKGKVTVIGTNNFSIDGEDGIFKVNITDKTKILRKFGGKSSFDELSVGDEVIVFGKFTDDTKSTIDAKTIKNNSIQKRFGAFFGKVTIKNSDNFVMETLERGVLTVYFGTAKLVDRKETGITIRDIKVGDRVRVKGVWDKTLSKITEVIQVKDFSIPVVVPTKASEN
ncbi:MAG: DUF5666 domain-containing protein [Patescibacteria group bacterium]|jgi:hypothetical protein